MKEIKREDFIQKCVKEELPFILSCKIGLYFKELKRIDKKLANKLLRELKNFK